MDDLRSRVAELYAATEPASWPDPHADREAAQEEYSRVTNGERWVIVQARTVAWLRACVELLGARIEPTLPAELPVTSEQRWTMTSPLPGTLPIHVRMVTGEYPMADLGVDAEVTLVEAPGMSCACDACDHGSETELELVDSFFERVLPGSLVQLVGHEFGADLDITTGMGGAGGHYPEVLEFEEAMELMRAIGRGEDVDLPAGIRSFHGDSWLDAQPGA